tara:strand:- start:1015 stop:1410 length:396 start_codon:yes stop_codon:yes gene_type:complete
MIAEWAAQYVGIPFVELGRERSPGVDCWGLVRLVYLEQYEIELPSYSYENCDNRTANARIFSAEKESKWRPVLAMTGSVVLFNVASRVCHAGVVVGDGKFIHAEVGTGVIMERLQSAQWRNRIEGFYEHDD